MIVYSSDIRILAANKTKIVLLLGFHVLFGASEATSFFRVLRAKAFSSFMSKILVLSTDSSMELLIFIGGGDFQNRLLVRIKRDLRCVYLYLSEK